jgi:ceramide glucosyltransferase
MADGGAPLVWGAASWWAASLLVQWLSAALGRRRAAADLGAPRLSAADFTIVAPLAGARDASPGYLAALCALSRAGAEVWLCVAEPDDPALPRVRAAWPDAPLLLGSDTTFNPKLNNIRKGLDAARRPFVALCDAGVAVGEADLVRAAALLSDRVGLVLALKAGTAPANFAAEMECAYINGHQARFLLAADRLGLAVASGGITILSRDTLHEIGGHRGFLHYIADDYSVVRAVRGRAGRTTRLADHMPGMPLGERAWGEVWRRQVRWGSTRLNLPVEVRALVLFEPVIGWFAASVAGVVAMLAGGLEASLVVVALVAHTIAWFAAEGWFLAGYGLPFRPRAWLAALVRELLMPVLAAQAWLGRHSIDWRGTDLAAGWRPAGDGRQGRGV